MRPASIIQRRFATFYWAWIFLLLLTVSSVPGSPISVKGKVEYRDDSYVWRPIRYGAIELLKIDIIVWHIAWASTDSEGNYSIDIDDNGDPLQGPATMFITVWCDTSHPLGGKEIVRVAANPLAASYFVKTTPVLVDQLNFEIDKKIHSDSYEEKPWWLYDDVIKEWEFLNNRGGVRPTKAGVWWPYGTQSMNDGANIQIAEGHEWIEYVVMHEYAHTNLYWAYDNQWPPGSDCVPPPHYINTVSCGGFALNEGWATFVYCAVVGWSGTPISSNLGDVDGDGDANSCFVDIEDDSYLATNGQWYKWYHGRTPPPNQNGNIVEGSAAAIFWDIFDSTEEDDDDLALGFDEIWHIIRVDNPDDVDSFWSAWLKHYDFEKEMWAIYYDHGINKDDDINAPTISNFGDDDNTYDSLFSDYELWVTGSDASGWKINIAYGWGPSYEPPSAPSTIIYNANSTTSSSLTRLHYFVPRDTMINHMAPSGITLWWKYEAVDLDNDWPGDDSTTGWSDWIHGGRCLDDDISPPSIVDHWDSGDAPPGLYYFKVKLSDASGILDDNNYPRIYYRWDNDEIDDSNYDDFTDADWDGVWYTANINVGEDKVGHTIYWRCLAYDNDNDRNNDRAYSWSPAPSYLGGTITSDNHPPLLSWTGEANYTSDGLHPETGNSTTSFVYRVKYTDLDNDAPKAGYPKVHILKGGSEIQGTPQGNSPFMMSQVDPGDVNYADGKLYTFTKNGLPDGTEYTYYFEAYDINNASASGDPTSPKDAPDVSSGCQQIVLNRKAQWISSHILPQPTALESVFAPCLSYLEIVQDPCLGCFYIPPDFNSCGNWDILEMYYVYMSPSMPTPQNLEICGQRVPSDSAIVLTPGWNCVVYLPENSMFPPDALSSIWSSLAIVYDDSGHFCIPDQFCNLYMWPGKGYLMYLNQSDTLTYPTASALPLTTCVSDEPLIACHFAFAKNTGKVYGVLVNSIELVDRARDYGDEIGIFNSDGLCVGAARWRDGHIGITSWGDDEYTEARDGFNVGEQMVFRYWDLSEDKELDLAATYNRGNGTFGDGPYASVELKVLSTSEASGFTLSQNYPNPFNTATSIEFHLLRTARITLKVYNLLGQEVRTLLDKPVAAGNHEVTWDGQDNSRREVSSGIYFYILEANGFKKVRKVLLLK